MLSDFLRAMDAMRAVLDETRVWTDHLSGEGPTTVRRHREVIARVLVTAPATPLARSAMTDKRERRPEAFTLRRTPRHRPALGTR
jgi:hypothetical protein